MIRSTDKGEWFDSHNLILFYQFSKTVTKSHRPFLRGYPEFIANATTFENALCQMVVTAQFVPVCQPNLNDLSAKGVDKIIMYVPVCTGVWR